mmetsp:Transcript_7027/g.14530  ORF Transcript_7027/g.14530 Transcript_7027/m.14530 type:complete len:959 (-) Transcript_7027:247-3123(-)
MKLKTSEHGDERRKQPQGRSPPSVLTSEISFANAGTSASTDAGARGSENVHDDTSANASMCLNSKDGPLDSGGSANGDASCGTVGSVDGRLEGGGNPASGGMMEPREKTRQMLEISENNDFKENLHQNSNEDEDNVEDNDDLDEVDEEEEQENEEQVEQAEIDNDEELNLAMAVIRRQEMFTRPGAYFVRGINYHPPGSTPPTAASAAAGISTAANDVQNPASSAEETKEEIILEGFLAPEPRRYSADASRRRSASSQNHSSNPNRDSPEETLEQRVERIKRHLLANVITLDDSAVKTIPMRRRQSRTDEDHESIENSEGGEEAEEGNASSSVGDLWKRVKRSWMNASFLRRTIFLISVVLLFAAVVILVVLFGTTNNSTTKIDHSTPATYEDPCDSIGDELSQLEGDATIRWEISLGIISSITPEHVLFDETSPQGKALRWIVCHDAISANFLNQHNDQKSNVQNRDANLSQPSLSKRTQTTTGYGFVNSGNSSKSQVLRRYILATLYYSTSINGPWYDDWNFLNGNEHECSWHKIYKRWNFQFGEVDPAGIVCQTGPLGDILLNDEEIVVGRLTVNFRIKNNLTGTLPPELGHLIDLADILVEQQEHLSGSLPPMMPNLTLIDSVSILFNGPDFGGEIPVSLLELPSLSYLTVKQNSGSWSLPDNVDNISPKLTNLDVSHSNFRGTIPRWIYESNVVVLDLAFNEFQGPIFPEDEIIDFLPRIELLSYHGNRHLYGTLPDALGRLGGTLKVLALGNNQIGGSVPESIGNLSNLELLSLDDNAMTGTLPSSMTSMTSLRHLVLSSNSFHGSVTVLESMKNLTSVLIHSNEFSGELPGGIFDGVSSDSSLYLDVGINRFSGDIPSSYGNVPNLTFFGATRNGFENNTVDNITCDNVEFTIMDCSACSCCNVCCDPSDDLSSREICDFHMDSFRLLGLECGPWWMYCNEPQTYYDVDPV